MTLCRSISLATTLASAFAAWWRVRAKAETAGGVFKVREDEPGQGLEPGYRISWAPGRPLERRAAGGGVRG